MRCAKFCVKESEYFTMSSCVLFAKVTLLVCLTSVAALLNWNRHHVKVSGSLPHNFIFDNVFVR